MESSLGSLDLSLSVSPRISSRAILFKPQVTTVCNQLSEINLVVSMQKRRKYQSAFFIVRINVYETAISVMCVCVYTSFCKLFLIVVLGQKV